MLKSRTITRFYALLFYIYICLFCLLSDGGTDLVVESVLAGKETDGEVGPTALGGQ